MRQSISIAIAILLALIVSSVITEGFGYIVLIMAGLGGFASSKCLAANNFAVGHGVNGKMHILGMPVVLFVCYSFIFLCLLVIMPSQQDGVLLHQETIANLQSFVASVAIGWLIGIIDWYTFSRKETFYFCENAVRGDLISKKNTCRKNC